MEREWLETRLAAAQSIEDIAREVGRHPSTVSYWVEKFGLESQHAARHRVRGGVSRDVLEELVDEGLTVQGIAQRLERGATTIRHWLARYNLRTHRQRSYAASGTVHEGDVLRHCRHHGLTRYVGDRSGYHRCAACRQERVAERRREIKRILVAEAGGRCVICGYDRFVGSLQFHHLDRATKEFHLSLHGLARSLEESRREAAKCALLCANCHAEVEGGVAKLPQAA